jgi:hypothetical protein
MDTDSLLQDKLQGNSLLPHHWQQLTEGSGIAPEVIAERGYRSIVPPKGYSEPHGFTRPQANLPGILMPLWTTDGRNGLVQYRPDTPRLDKDGKPVKYETPKGAGVQIDCPPRCRPMLADPSIALWVTYSGFRSDVRGPPLFPLGAATCQLYASYMRVKTALRPQEG